MDIRKYFKIEESKNNSSSASDGSTPVFSYDEIKIDKLKTHEIFTDGSTYNNGKKNKTQYGGVGVYFGKDDKRNISYSLKSLDKITNNIAELTAILFGIETIIDKNKTKFFEEDRICIYSDSEYCINCITKWSKKWSQNNWQRVNKNKKVPVKNKELISKIYNYYSSYNINFVHVRSHQPEPFNKNSKKFKIWYGNHMADKLANLGSQK